MLYYNGISGEILYHYSHISTVPEYSKIPAETEVEIVLYLLGLTG